LLNVVSLSSFIDEILGWRSWVSDALLWYRALTANILQYSGLVPHHVPSAIVAIISQLLVFMGGVFAAANFYALRTEGQSVFRRVYDTACRPSSFARLCAISKTAVIYLLGPALLLFVLWKSLSRRTPIQRVLGFTFRPSHVAAYYLSLLGSVTIALVLAGFFYAQVEKQVSRGLGVASWLENRLLL
jgi:hypothetical protein